MKTLADLRYLSKREISFICSENSMCRDTFDAFEKEHPSLVGRIVDIFSTGFNFPRGHIKYELNYKIYEFVLED